MWDAQSLNLLSSKHDSFLTSKDEIGMVQSSDNDNEEHDDKSTSEPTSTSTPSSRQKRNRIKKNTQNSSGKEERRL